VSCRIDIENVAKIYRSPVGGHGRVSLWSALRGAVPNAGIREIRAVDSVSLSLRQGERLGVVGRNGAGKSSLLHLIAGMSTPTFGRIEIEGRVHAVLTLGTVLREEATGRENIYLDGAIQGRDRAEIDAIVDEIIDFSELGEFIDRPVRTYSTGMKSRLAFSLLAFIDPEVLVIDEALGAGDAFFAAKAQRRMKELSQAGRIAIIVSHSTMAIVKLCTRCIWMDAGRIIMDGDPTAVTRAYEDAVSSADDVELRRKFGRGLDLPASELGEIDEIRLLQSGTAGGAALLALRDTVIEVKGRGAAELRRPDLEARLIRLDGAVLWQERASRRGDTAGLRRSFRLSLAMRPLVLGPHAYRLDLTLLDGDQAIASRSAVFEVRDEEGQEGGVPMVLYPLKAGVVPAAEAAETIR
jgi:lipopolysaccharide transport system ATP-binding protein